MELLKRHYGKIIAIVIIIAVLFFLGRGLTNASVEETEITGLSAVTTESFNLTGELHINNPAYLSVPVEKVEYVIILNDSKETISTGNIPSFTLKAQSDNHVDFEHETKWVPTGQMAVQLLTDEHVYGKMKGNVTVSVLGITSYKLSFEKPFDMKEYVRQFTGGTPNIGLDEDSQTDQVQNTAEETVDDTLNNSDNEESTEQSDNETQNDSQIVDGVI